jgi:transcriptional accessory protein Tex/SPT6
MNEAHILKIADELKVQPRQVAATAKLFAEGVTVPFIARIVRNSPRSASFASAKFQMRTSPT